ncbi:MAG: VOC family protein [Pleurocapsa minor GSE-CHR-MK-17-07R]|jgi:PhnB protein|nr:VOC family protein [Pleurocapsa minor GSE-CHR-MK 17-07R]
MSRISVYLNFMGKTEEAFNFYRSVFGTEFAGPITYMGDAPADPSRPPLSEAEQKLVMHVELPILGGGVLMGTDMLESQGHQLSIGNGITINLEPDTREEGDRLFTALSAGGQVTMPLTDMFWGDRFGTIIDRYGIPWMFNFPGK